MKNAYSVSISIVVRDGDDWDTAGRTDGNIEILRGALVGDMAEMLTAAAFAKLDVNVAAADNESEDE